jgi:hypothetical protein
MVFEMSILGRDVCGFHADSIAIGCLAGRLPGDVVSAGKVITKFEMVKLSSIPRKLDEHVDL